jgi:hypothetical protein
LDVAVENDVVFLTSAVFVSASLVTFFAGSVVGFLVAAGVDELFVEADPEEVFEVAELFEDISSIGDYSVDFKSSRHRFQTVEISIHFLFFYKLDFSPWPKTGFLHKRKNLNIFVETKMTAAHHTQFDILYSHRDFGILPKHLPGRVLEDDYIYFHVPAEMNASLYDVVIESMDTAAPTPFRNLGSLSQVSVPLPFVYLDAYARVFVIPKSNPSLPTFFARLNRGSTYTIPSVGRTPPGAKIQMKRSGALTAGS